MAWRYAVAVSTGSGHRAAGLPCQDRAVAELVRDRRGEQVLVAAVSDGAGSAERADAGAACATSAFLACATAALRTQPLRAITATDAASWILGARKAVEALAAEEMAKPGDYACTLLGAVVGRRAAVFAQIGDGAILAHDALSEGWSFVFWPQRGEFANTTSFLTDAHALSRVETRAVEGCIDEAVLFTDGLQALALDLEGRRVHAPFVEGLMRPLRGARGKGECVALSEQLGRFLDLPRVIARTDDDKTVIIATRRRKPAPMDVAADPASVGDEG
jgi:hypothetical protein